MASDREPERTLEVARSARSGREPFVEELLEVWRVDVAGQDAVAVMVDEWGIAHRGASARTSVPWPGALSTSTVPPMAAARSRIESKPRWPGKEQCGSNP